MDRIIALIGSPRKLGNCELAARYIAWEAGCSELEFVRLGTRNILPCKACYRCLEGKCPLDDDYGEIMERILAAEGVIVAVPSYFFGPNASVKRFLDRGLQLYALYERLIGKPAVGICIAGMEFGEGYTKLGVENTILRMGFQNRGTETIYGALPGEIFMVDGNVDILKELGQRLAGGEEKKEQGNETEFSCGSCGYAYFSFSGPDSASCLVCGTRHRSSVEINLEKVENTGVMLGSREELAEHREWLIGMKQRYMTVREELKKVIREYHRPGREI